MCYVEPIRAYVVFKILSICQKHINITVIYDLTESPLTLYKICITILASGINFLIYPGVFCKICYNWNIIKVFY
jgi:hypothetical protein